MSTVQGNLKKKSTGDYVAPNTTTAAVYDAAREQALSATLVDLPDKSALGYPSFSTAADYSEGNVVYYENKLWKFTSDHEHGAWDEDDVDEFSIKDILDALAESLGGEKFLVISEAFALIDARLKSVEAVVMERTDLTDIEAMEVNAREFYKSGYPLVLRCATAGAPAAARVPDNWDEATMGVWRGVPMFVGQHYIDQASNKVYEACNVSNSTNDWKVLN